MFLIESAKEGEIVLSGRLDAAQAEKARDSFQHIHDSRIVNFEKLEYISSAAPGVLLAT